MWQHAEDFATVLADAQAGSPSAFETLYRTYAGAVTGYARMQGISDPEDVTSETFIGAVKNLDRFTGDEPAFRSWLFTIAHHRIVDIRRRQARRLHLVPVESEHLDRPAPQNTEADALESTTTEELRRKVEMLVPDQRDVLLLRLIGGLTVNEIASNLHKTEGAVKALQRRGLASLRKILEEGVPL